MNRKVQKLAAQALGVKDEAVFADQTANKWARKNKYEDNAEDTLRHILLGGLMQSVPGEGIGRIGKGIAGMLINRREEIDDKNRKESRIDIVNNNFGKALRQQLVDEKDTSVESFVTAAQKAVTNLIKNKPIKEIESCLSILYFLKVSLK